MKAIHRFMGGGLALSMTTAGCDIAEPAGNDPGVDVAGQIEGAESVQRDELEFAAAKADPLASSVATWEVDEDDWVSNVDGDGVRMVTHNLRYNPVTQEFDIPVAGSLDVKVNSAGEYLRLMTDMAKFWFNKTVKMDGRLEIGSEDVYGKHKLWVDGAAMIGTMPPLLDGQGNLTPDPLPTPYDYKLWVRGGPAFFNGLPPQDGNNGQTWTTAVVIAANDGLTKPTDALPNREMRFLGGGPIAPSSGAYGAGISWGLAPQAGSSWRPGAYSSQQFLLGYWGDFLWLRGSEKPAGGSPQTFPDADVRNLVRFSANSAYHPLAVFGNIWAHGFIQSSDERLKRDIQTLKGALGSVLALRGTSYEYAPDRRSDLNLPAGRQFGFVAQEVKKVLPWLVKEDGTGTFAVSYDGFVPLLVEAVKEQNSAIVVERERSDSQEEELASLRREVAEMRAQMEALEGACSSTLTPAEHVASRR